MELQFKSIDHKIDSILSTLKEQNVQTEKRFAEIERKLEDIEKEQGIQKVATARYQVIWGMGATLGSSLVVFILNRIF